MRLHAGLSLFRIRSRPWCSAGNFLPLRRLIIYNETLSIDQEMIAPSFGFLRSIDPLFGRSFIDVTKRLKLDASAKGVGKANAIERLILQRKEFPDPGTSLPPFAYGPAVMTANAEAHTICSAFSNLPSVTDCSAIGEK